MAKYELTAKAISDLNKIWEYTIKNWSENQADRYYNMLLDICQDIANNPEIGRNYDEIKPELFGVKINRHIIFYRKMRGRPIEITRILHERIDIKTRMSE